MLKIQTPDMAFFACPRCLATFNLEGWWIYHLESEHGLAPVLLKPTVADPSQVTKSVPNVATPSIRTADNIIPAVQHSGGPKLSFRVEYDLGKGGETQPIRLTIPKDESYDKFLRRLHDVFYGDSFERSHRQWEYVLVNRQYLKGNPLPLTSSNTYYAMVSELLRPRSPWRHAVIQRSVSLTRYKAGSDTKLMRFSIRRTSLYKLLRSQSFIRRPSCQYAMLLCLIPPSLTAYYYSRPFSLVSLFLRSQQ